jgi:hypothetical protein
MSCCYVAAELDELITAGPSNRSTGHLLQNFEED